MTRLEQCVRTALHSAGVRPGDAVTVAFSGGADSTALLACLCGLDLRLAAAHLHHGLRGAEADRDADFCRTFCEARSIPLTVERCDAAAYARRTGQSLEAAARELRYEFLERVSPGWIATAHNADDNAETVLLHLLRGTGPRGLGGIPPVRGRLVRPLLDCTREEILAYLDETGLPHVEDGTNAADDCLRNRLRHRVLPLLRAENPAFASTVGRTSALVRAEDAYLSALAAKAEEASRRDGGWDCSALRALDPVLRRRVLLGLLRALGLENPSRVYVEALEGLVFSDAPSARIDLPGGTARREYGLLRFGAPPPTLEVETVLRVPGTTVLPNGGTITCAVTKNLHLIEKNPNTFALKCDMIAQKPLTVRSRRPGDRLRLSGGSKTVKRLLIDRKIPAARRGGLPVLTDGETVLAVFGLGADPAFCASRGEEALVLSWNPESYQ